MIAWLIATAAMLIVSVLEISGALNIDNLSTSSAIIVFSVAVGFILVNITTIIIFGMWIFRAAANIRDESDLPMSDSPGMSVGWYFIPFLNWGKPYTAMRQIWNASTGDHHFLDEGNPTLHGWWAMWLVSNITANISLRMTLSSDSPTTQHAVLVLDIISGITAIILYFAASKVISTITEGQQQGLHLPMVEAAE
jgi:hypothetical protein